MLTYLSIRNFLLFQEVNIDFSPQLNVLTGETGAGKSILIDAINIAFGSKTSPDMIFHSQNHAVITLTFSLNPPSQNLSSFLNNNTIPFDHNDIIIRRDIFRQGRSQSRVNDTLVSSSLLASLKAHLLVIQGQFDPHGLLSHSKHLPLLDTYASLHTSSLSHAYRSWQNLLSKWQGLCSRSQKSDEQKQLLLFHLQELENLDPLPNEIPDLEITVKQLKKAHLVIENLNQAHDLLNSQALPPLERALNLLESPPISESFQDLGPLLRSGREETFAAIETISAHAENLLSDRENIQSYEDRLYALRDLSRKHKSDNLHELIPSLTQQLQDLDNLEEQENNLKKDLDLAREHYISLAQTISKKRSQGASKLCETVHKELSLLAMPKARFHVEITSLPEEKWGGNGQEHITFLLATNPHHAPAPLAKIASGGELNRLLLAIQSSLASAHLYPSMIFDEIDSGIGGKTAAILAQRLSALARHTQILAVTHAPQLAAYGEQHLFVEKDNTSTRVSLLSPEQRIEDIARMISGTTINDSARNAAQKLICEAENYKASS